MDRAKRRRKETAWKKSRKFGDVKGGRIRPKLADNIFKRTHGLEAPGEQDDVPIFIKDNPSRDFFFPVTIEEVKAFLAKLPEEHTNHLTHVWLRKMSRKEYEMEGRTQGAFITGSGVRLIVLYPFAKDLTMRLGKKKPSKKLLRWYAAYKPALVENHHGWQLIWTKEQLKRYYLEGLLLHEIGHQVDSFNQRYWSSGYRERGEKFADCFAYYWGEVMRGEV